MRVVRLVCAVSAHFYICIMRIRRSWAKGAAVLTIPEGKACGNTKKKDHDSHLFSAVIGVAFFYSKGDAV